MRVRIGLESLALIMSGNYRVQNWPGGARIINASWNAARMVFEIVLEHNSFDAIPESHEIPVLGLEVKGIWTTLTEPAI